MAAVASTSAVVEAPKMVVLRSSDGKEFEVESLVAKQSEMIKNIIDDGCGEHGVPLANVVGSVLAKVVEYWNRHGRGKEEEKLMEWDKKFVKVDKDELFDLINAANYLNTKPLLDLCCQTMADIIKDMTIQDVRDYFGIENDFTPEEEDKFFKEKEPSLSEDEDSINRSYSSYESDYEDDSEEPIILDLDENQD